MNAIVSHSVFTKGWAIMNYLLYELAGKNNAIAIEAIMPPGIYSACLF